jgi:hypothetical protein
MESIPNANQQSINCSTTEELHLVLTRASSAPLCLEVGWKCDRELLNPIIIRGLEIHSLSVQTAQELGYSLDGLNISALKRLDFFGLQWQYAKEIMDLSLNSTQETMNIVIFSSELLPRDVFEHELLQRAEYLKIEGRK